MKPITRKELYLNKIVGNNDYETPEKPITTEEFFFAEILGEAVQAPEPLTRYQIYLAKIAGKDVEIPYPETRLEYFLAKAAGMDIETPTPITREEIYWSNYTAIVELEVEGVPPLTYKAIEGTLENYRIYGNTVDGESVGDLVTSGEHAGEYKVPVTVEGKNLVTSYLVEPNGGIQFTPAVFAEVNLQPNTEYLITFTVHENGVKLYSNDLLFAPVYYSSEIQGKETMRLKTKTSIRSDQHINNKGWVLLRNAKNAKQNPSDFTITDVKLQLVSDAPIYLPEQIKKVGDEAEYIDYGEQKMHRVRKNLLQNTATSQTRGRDQSDPETYPGVAFTVNDDKSVTCNGASNQAVYIYLCIDFIPEEGITYLYSGCPQNGGIMSYELDLINPSGIIKQDIGNGITFDSTSRDGYLRVRLRIGAGYTCNNLTFYPMIRKSDIEDDTYEPYIENTDLDVTLPELPTLPGTNVLSVGTAVQPSKVYVKYKGERQ